MNLPDSFDSRPYRLESPVNRVLVIHDDAAAGIRAMRLVDHIGRASGGNGAPRTSFWMSCTLETAECAVAAWIDAEKSDAVLVSLGAGAEICEAVMVWLEAWIPYAGGDRTRLVVLSESSPADDDDYVGMRAQLQRLCRKSGVDIHWHCGSVDHELDGAEESLPECDRSGFASARGLFTAAAAFAI